MGWDYGPFRIEEMGFPSFLVENSDPSGYSLKLTNVYNQLTGGSRYQIFDIIFDLLMVIFVGKRKNFTTEQ